jgi:hypothetical protein
MEPKQHQSHKQSNEQKSGQATEPETGGREFGQVIEPMQAQMASGNEGLTDQSATKPKHGEMKRAKKRKKAA